MANQDPQPEIYTTRYAWNADTTTATGATIAAGTSQVVSIYTNQANNEEVRIRGWLTTSTTAVRFLCSPLRFLFFSNNLYPSQSLQVLPSQVSETLLTTEQSQLT